MKDYIRIMCAVLVILILIPLVSYADKRSPAKQTAAEKPKTVKMLMTKTGEIKTLTLHEYIVGAVFAQMPADFGTEALKAQAVLAATYIKRRELAERSCPSKELGGALISDDRSLYQAYFTEQQAKTLYGDEYPKALKRMNAAADYAENYLLTFDGEPIAPAFHGISYGRTESALDVWGEDIPYLVSVESPYDEKLDECRSEVRFSADELEDILAEEFGISIGDEGIEITPSECTSGGTALKVNVCGKEFDSETFCEKLGLASAHFECVYTDGEYVFNVSGCGHLVGMSEYGANEMAKSGSSAKEILLHYFKGTVLEKTKD